jgi:hypothetical protein
MIGPNLAEDLRIFAEVSITIAGFAAVTVVIQRRVNDLDKVLFFVVTVHLFQGQPLDALSRPLPFFVYPLLVATMFGWAWEHYRLLV